MTFEPRGVRGLLGMRTSARHRPASADAEAPGSDVDSTPDMRPSTAPPAGARVLTPVAKEENGSGNGSGDGHEQYSWLSSNLGAVAEDDGSALAEASDALEGIRSFNEEWRQERERLLQQLEKEYGFALPQQVHSENACAPSTEDGEDLAGAEDEHEADCALESAQRDIQDVRRRRQEAEERVSRPASRAGVAQPSQSSSTGFIAPADCESPSGQARLSTLRAEVQRLKAADAAPAAARAPLALQLPEEPIVDERGAMADLNAWLAEVRALTEGSSPKKIVQVASPTRVSSSRAERELHAKSRLEEELAALQGGSDVDSSSLTVAKSELERHLDEILGEFDEFDRIANDLGVALSPECVS